MTLDYAKCAKEIFETVGGKIWSVRRTVPQGCGL